MAGDLTASRKGEREMLATENLYLAAYALTHGARLRRIVVSRTNGRSMAVFELESPWAQKLHDEYYAGTAVVNLAEYRQHLERLKDELFSVLKRNETRRRDHEEDRKGRARSAQAFG